MRTDFNGKKVCRNTLNRRNSTAKNFVPYMFVDCVDLSGEGDIPLEKNNAKVDSLYQPKNRCISDPEMCYNARF